LWHGVWRGGQGKLARLIPQPTPAKPAAAPSPAPQPSNLKEFSILADPGDVRASRMAKDFAAIMSAS
jgi:hypothetical protein